MLSVYHPERPRNGAAFERARADVESIFIDSAAQMEALRIADHDRLVAWAGDGRVNDLDLPELEFSAPRSVFQNTIDRTMVELLALERADAGSVERRAADVALACRGLLEPLEDRDFADETRLRSLGCATIDVACPAVAASGLARRILVERAIGRGDRELGRLKEEQVARTAWWPIRSDASDAVLERSNVHMQRALGAYEAAGRLAVTRLADEAPMISERPSTLLGAFPAGSPEAARAGRIGVSAPSKGKGD
jgi:hypothetical protein